MDSHHSTGISKAVARHLISHFVATHSFNSVSRGQKLPTISSFTRVTTRQNPTQSIYLETIKGEKIRRPQKTEATRLFAIVVLLATTLLTALPQVAQAGPLGPAIINTMPNVIIEHGRAKLAKKLEEIIERERRKKADTEKDD